MPCCELTMKNVVLYLLLLFPALAWAQKDLVIEGPNDKVAPVTLQVKSDFDQDKGVLKLMITGDNTDECNALWLLEDATPFGALEKYFKQHDDKLKISSFAKEQVKFMNLADKNALPVVNVKGAQLVGNPVVQTKTGVKASIQKQILPLDNRSSLVIAMQVQEGVEQVDLTLVNPLLLYNDNGKYQLAFIGKDATMSIDVKVDRCAANACLLDQLKEYNAIFSKGEATLLEMKKTQNTCINKVKSLLVSEYTLINLKRFENTKCQEINDSLVALKNLFDRINNFDTSHETGGGGGVAGSTGQAAMSAMDDCNVKKVNDDLKSAVVKLNTYANDWMSAADPAVKQAKKVAFDSLVKETDSEVNALSPSCKKKVDDNSLKNFEMAKKLIKN